MNPFFNFLGNQISWYAAMGLYGFIAAVLFLFIQCRKSRFSFDDAIYIFVLAMISVMVGAKGLYLITASQWISIAGLIALML